MRITVSVVAVSDVIVVGAGAIGVTTALELARRGASVQLLERGPGPASGCSAGSSGIVGAAQVAPLASLETLREGVASLLQRSGPFSVQPGPETLRWLGGFVVASAPSRYRAAASLLAALARESAHLHAAYGEQLDTGFAPRGLLMVYETERAWRAARRQVHPSVDVLDGKDVRNLCGQLAVMPAGALFVDGQAHCDPERYVASVAEAAVTLGTRISTGVEVLGIGHRGGRASLLRTSSGTIPVGELVLAAGAWTPALVSSLQLTVPIRGGKGYHIDYLGATTDSTVPVYFPEHRVVATPLAQRLRLAGMLQLVGTDLSIDTRRVRVIRRHGQRMLSGLHDRRVIRIWSGLRPCTPDGLPMIGRVPTSENVTLAAGHGMWGLQLAPVTARLVADLLTTRDGDLRRLYPLRPERFDRRR